MSLDLKQNYFKLFGLPASYAVDRDALDQRYRELQRLVHPDRFVNAGDQERRVTLQQATQINEAYRVLKDTLARGRYLLELRGHHFDDERNTHQDSAFLMEQIELREALAEVHDSHDPFAALSQIMEQIDARLSVLDSELADALARDSVDAAALTAIQRMQFFRKLAHEAEELEADLEDAS